MSNSPSRFRQSALASGLLTEAQLDAATAALRDDHRKTGVSTKVADEELAAKLVALGHLNAWQSEQLLSGRTKWNLGPYRIVDTIGQGGMGQVFKAEHTIMRRMVAIKVLPLSKSTPESIANFSREIQAQAQLDHENLVRAYDAGQDGNVHFLVTEYVPGLDLRRYIKRHGRLSQSAAAAIICQAAHGLEHAHARGLIHRDVKPGNLLVTPDGHVKVSDLGLAGFLHDEDERQRNKTVGTADYLSPEQILTPNNLTPACDIYALGCTLYYAVTGKVPFPGGTTSEKARAHCHETPIDPRRLNPELDADFVDVLGDMMVKDPAKRIGSAAEVVRRLAEWAGEEEFWPATVAGMVSAARPPRIRVGPSGLEAAPVADLQLLPEAGDFEERESPSQTSEPTAPLASMSEETIPLAQPIFPAPPRDGLSVAVLIAIWLAVTAALAVIGTIIFKLLT
ncbi:MAG: serine/threonine protein kinase [Planctomycetia bacterium]|nr:serine/threonine protein kinase [Planctomycetia bacterium]